MRFALATGLFIAAASLAFSQTAPAPDSAPAASPQPAAKTFEVASIKPAAPPTDGRIMVRMGNDPGRLDYSNVALINLLTQAFKVKEHQINGPDWIRTTRFDLAAKIPAGATKDEVPGMLQALLAERFKLTLHKEAKVVPAYALVPVKGGLKMKEVEAPAAGENRTRMMMGPRGRRMTGNMTMQQFADTLSNWMDRPVVNMTDARGTYEIDIEWTGDEGPAGMRAMRAMHGGGEGGGPGPGAPRPEGGSNNREIRENTEAPSIFTALQEKLGLKLDSRKEPVDLLIIDQLEKVPTEN